MQMQQVYMNARCREILRMLLESDTWLTQQQIADALQVTKRSIYYDLCRINEWLDFHHIPELEMVRGRGILIHEEVRRQIEECADEIQGDESYILSPMERVHMIICAVIYSSEPVYIDQLQDYCAVSRNTIFNDLRVVVNQLQDYDLKLEYESRKGYRVVGDPIKIRAVFLMNFQEIRSIFAGGGLRFVDREKVGYYTRLLQEMEEELNSRYVDGILESLAMLLPLMEGEGSNVYFPNLKKPELEKTKEFELIRRYFPNLEEKEQIYLCLHLLGARVAVASNDIFEYNSNQTVYEMTKALIAEFEKTACVIFEDKEELGRALFIHINSSLYRYQYGIQIINSMSEDIIREYPDLFEITRIVSRYIEQQIGLPIRDAEIAYLALHFGAHLSIAPPETAAPRILIVCANGISTGNMLKRELQKLLPGARIVGTVSAERVTNAQNICDLIVSTVKLKSVIPVIQVRPILTASDREAILKRVKDRPSMIDIEHIFDIVKPYLEEKDYRDVRRELEDYYTENSRKSMEEMHKNHSRGLLDILPAEHIGIHEGGTGCRWTQALYESGGCLVEKGIIERRYVDNIISSIRYYGPYMFISSGVILAHAKPEDGVRHLGLSLHLYQEPVEFSDFYRASVILILAAVDQESHLKILKDILNVFTIEARVDDLVRKKDPEEVLGYIRGVLENENGKQRN